MCIRDRAWAEWRFGAARGHSDMVMITLGTGIGGAILRDGRVERGRWGIAGEFGHMQVVPDGQRCECGNRGCGEQYASGNALVREARSMIAVSYTHLDVYKRQAEKSIISGALGGLKKRCEG